LIADDLTSAHVLGNVVELVAVRNHARLRRKGYRDAVTSRCGFGAINETCDRRPRNTNTVVSLGLETTAVIAVEVVFTDVGLGSPLLTSTQYEFPICILLQPAAMLGFLCGN